VCVQIGLNSLADWSLQEYKQHALGYRPDLKMGLTSSANPGFMYANTTAKKSVDWREEGAVSEVKNQAQVQPFPRKASNPQACWVQKGRNGVGAF